MEYHPDNWVIIKLEHAESPGGFAYKVLGGWSGGYLDGNYWRLNSGIERWTEDEKYYYFHGYSGSVYKCFKEAEFTRMNNAGMLKKLIDYGVENSIIVEEIKAIDMIESFENGGEKV